MDSKRESILGSRTKVHMRIITPQKLRPAILVLVGVAAALLIQHRSGVQQRVETQMLLQKLSDLTDANESLSNRLARLAVTRTSELSTSQPVAVASTAAVAPAPFSTTNLYTLMTNNNAKLAVSQLDHYLESHRRSAASLLAAFRTTGDPELLAEAAQKYPDHAQVNFEAALHKDVPPEERRSWLDALKQSAPENALANYLSAADYFRSGQTDQAIQELAAASAKTDFKDYTLERLQDDEEAYRAAGYSVAESQLVANQQLLLPQLVQTKELSSQMLGLADAYRQNGDEASRQAILEMALNLGRRYSESAPGESLISQLVGVAVERNTLAAMDPQAAVDVSGQTALERLDQLTQTRTAIQELAKQADPIWHSINEQDWGSYNSRSLAFGEHAALQWLVGKGIQP
jgi:hypothetical protein